MNSPNRDRIIIVNRNHHVTAVINHRVRPGRQEGYEAWIKGISVAAREFEGHLGVSILRPQSEATPNYTIVLQFGSAPHLERWLGSEVRKSWIERVVPLIQEQESVQILTGLESWFQLPKQTGQGAPKRYKQAILIWVAVMVVSLGVHPLLVPLFPPCPGCSKSL